MELLLSSNHLFLRKRGPVQRQQSSFDLIYFGIGLVYSASIDMDRSNMDTVTEEHPQTSQFEFDSDVAKYNGLMDIVRLMSLC